MVQSVPQEIQVTNVEQRDLGGSELPSGYANTPPALQ